VANAAHQSPPACPSPRQPRASTSSTGRRAAERRLVSILFADLFGFTTLAEGRDAEDTRELLSRYFDLATEVITRYGGIVEKFIGDAVMAVWGAPTAHERGETLVDILPQLAVLACFAVVLMTLAVWRFRRALVAG
jgi:class 3 adenylate cyclase